MKKSIVTKNGLGQLKEKLNLKVDQLKAIREEKAIAYSASGDGWHDNPGWIQLGQQEEMLAQEVAMLQHKINSSTIIDTSKLDSERVQVGSKVEFLILKDNNQSVEQVVYIVGAGESDVRNKRISYDSVMGQALCNMKLHEEKKVILPIGTVIVKIKCIKYE
jgi:transcription elongation GreA/GreB family factor